MTFLGSLSAPFEAFGRGVSTGQKQSAILWNMVTGSDRSWSEELAVGGGVCQRVCERLVVVPFCITHLRTDLPAGALDSGVLYKYPLRHSALLVRKLNTFHV
jgi:hypothetical protein